MIALAAWGIDPDGPRCYLLDKIRDDRARRWLRSYLLGLSWRTLFSPFCGSALACFDVPCFGPMFAGEWGNDWYHLGRWFAR